jgi:cytochrome P450
MLQQDTVEDSIRFYDAAPMALERTLGWAYVRERGEVYEADGLWYLTSPQAVRFAQHHPEIFSSAKGYRIGSPIPMIPLMIDPPDHARYRRILDPMLSPRVVKDLEGDLRAQAGALIDAFVTRGECDAVSEIAELFPTQVLLTLMGLPSADRDKFHGWASTLTSDNSGSPNPTQVAAGAALFEYLQEHLDWKRAHPSDDMIGRVLALSDEDAWSAEEVLGMCFLFVLAALDTTTGAIGFTLYHLASRPDLRQAVLDDPELISSLVEEILRLELPAPTVPRMTMREVEVCGVTIPADAPVIIVMATANRESDDGTPDNDINVAQAGRAHVTFGAGIHRCLGSHLARLELRLIVEEFHARIPDYKIADGYQPQIAWPNSTFHLESLPLVF